MGEQFPIPRTFHQIWLGDPEPPSVLSFRESWTRHHPDWQLKVWRDEDVRGLVNQRLFDLAPSYAVKADIARLEILHREGGVYVDSDIECHRPLDALFTDFELVLLSEGDLLTNSFFGAKPGSDFLRHCIHLMSRVEVDDLTPSAWSPPKTGPMLLTRAAVETDVVFAAGTRVLPAETMTLPRSRNGEVVALAEKRRWATHHALATWRAKDSWKEQIKRTRLRTRVRRFMDLTHG